MKFDPNQDSLVIALNMECRFEELRLLKNFYDGEPTRLIGIWDGNLERSYQLNRDKIKDKKALITLLDLCNQEAYLEIRRGSVYLLELGNTGCRDLGFMEKIKDPLQGNCTLCIESQTFWMAVRQ
jgi:hypothetical protein